MYVRDYNTNPKYKSQAQLGRSLRLDAKVNALKYYMRLEVEAMKGGHSGGGSAGHA